MKKILIVILAMSLFACADKVCVYDGSIQTNTEQSKITAIDYQFAYCGHSYHIKSGVYSIIWILEKQYDLNESGISSAKQEVKNIKYRQKHNSGEYNK